jgi:hypothetical protein
MVFYVASLPAYRVLMVRLYERTESLPLAMLMHASFSASMLILQPTVIGLRAGLTWNLVLAALLWATVGAVVDDPRSRRMRTTGRGVPVLKPDPIVALVQVFIARKPGAVFDYFSDLRNEPQYNSDVREIMKTSPGGIGQGTTFEGLHRGFGSVTWRLSEYRRPAHVVIEGRIGRGAYRWESDFEEARGGTRMAGRMEWQPPARWRPFRFLLGPFLRWNARRSFRRLANVLGRGSR